MVAVGDSVTLNNSTSGSGTFTVQPSGTMEYEIHTIYVNGNANLIMDDGSHPVTIRPMPAGELITNVNIRVTNGVAMKLTDTSTATNLMHVDGVVTHT